MANPALAETDIAFVPIPDTLQAAAEIINAKNGIPNGVSFPQLTGRAGFPYDDCATLERETGFATRRGCQQGGTGCNN
jgi:hypothetical protein